MVLESLEFRLSGSLGSGGGLCGSMFGPFVIAECVTLYSVYIYMYIYICVYIYIEYIISYHIIPYYIRLYPVYSIIPEYDMLCCILLYYLILYFMVESVETSFEVCAQGSGFGFSVWVTGKI